MPNRKRSSQSYAERLQALIPENRRHVEKFLKTKYGSSANYKSQIFIFVEYLNHVSVDDISLSDIKNYLSQQKKPGQVVNIIRYLTPFLELIPSQISNITLLKDIAKKTQKKVENKEPISLEDVITFRNKLILDDDQKTLFVFEMLYVYGVKWKDFKNITEKDYSPLTGELKTKSKGTIKLTDNLRDLLKNHPEVLSPKPYSVLASYLRDASVIFGQSITETVIEATRNKYFPVCQRCNCQYPNSSEYWALVECKEDKRHIRWLICVSCASEVGRRQA